MNRTLVIILLVAVGIYCLPSLIAIAATILGLLIGLVGAVIGIGLTLLFTVLPLVILGYLIWWLVRDNKRSRQY